MLEPVYEADPDGRPVVHHRIVDTLGIMLRAGTITKEMHDAARDFQAQFTIARFDVVRLHAADRLPGGERARRSDRCPGRCTPSCRRSDGRARRSRQPGRRLRLACRRAAALDPRMGDAAGLGWHGRCGVEQAQGILVAALGMLAGHYGYEQEKSYYDQRERKP